MNNELKHRRTLFRKNTDCPDANGTDHLLPTTPSGLTLRINVNRPLFKNVNKVFQINGLANVVVHASL